MPLQTNPEEKQDNYTNWLDTIEHHLQGMELEWQKQQQQA